MAIAALHQHCLDSKLRIMAQTLRESGELSCMCVNTRRQHSLSAGRGDRGLTHTVRPGGRAPVSLRTPAVSGAARDCALPMFTLMYGCCCVGRSRRCPVGCVDALISDHKSSPMAALLACAAVTLQSFDVPWLASW